jgi:hypothetical protein
MAFKQGRNHPPVTCNPGCPAAQGEPADTDACITSFAPALSFLPLQMTFFRLPLHSYAMTPQREPLSQPAGACQSLFIQCGSPIHTAATRWCCITATQPDSSFCNTLYVRRATFLFAFRLRTGPSTPSP